MSPGDHDEIYFAEDADDRRAALESATALVAANNAGYLPPHEVETALTHLADAAYLWLRGRDSLKAVRLELLAGTPYPEGGTPMTATIDLSDTDSLPFSLGGTDAKGASVPAPSDTWAWTLTDPDVSGAVLTVSTDTTSAVVAAGTPTANLSLSVAGANTGLQGAEAIIVQATAATTVDLVPGTPAPE